MTALHIDFETRSALDLRKVGLWNYARHPSTDVWCMAGALDDEEPWLVTPATANSEAHILGGQPGMYDAINHVQEGLPVYAHNAAFELEIWNQIMVPRYGWPVLRPEQTYCTLAMSYAMALPGALEDAAKAAGLDIHKDLEGRALMLRMARPRRIVEEGYTRRYIWWDEPEKLARLYEYCKQDVRVERALHARLRPLSERERRVWLMDYAINQRGVRADLPTAEAGVALAASMKDKCDNALAIVTKGAALSTTALAPLKDWLAAQGVPNKSLDKEHVADLLEGDLPEAARKALILRQESSLASTAKLEKILDLADVDARLHNMLAYHGANTGRWAARGVQLHNLPRDVPPQAQVERILALVRAGKIDTIDMLYGPPMATLSRCLRGFFIPAPGSVFCAGDFSGVESRGGAWFCGEQWKLDAFRAADAGTGPGIYEATAAGLLGKSVEEITRAERQAWGKIPELSLIYQGGLGAMRRFGFKGTDAEGEAIKHGWRGKHPNVRQTWYDLQRAAISAVQAKGQVFSAGAPGRQAHFLVQGSFLWCKLPSGRLLSYPYPKILQDEYGDKLTYMTVPSPDDHKSGRIIDDPWSSSNWVRIGTYGGSLLENIVQAFCRDLLVDAMLALHEQGARIVLHVHDEIVVEVERAKAEGARAEMERVMRTPLAWANGFPLTADVGIMERYGK